MKTARHQQDQQKDADRQHDSNGAKHALLSSGKYPEERRSRLRFTILRSEHSEGMETEGITKQRKDCCIM